MSRIISQQNQAMQQRQERYAKESVNQRQTLTTPLNQMPTIWLLAAAFLVIVILNLFFNLRMLALVKQYSSVKADTHLELGKLKDDLHLELEKIKDLFAQQNRRLNAKMEVTDSVFKDSLKEISQLKKQLEVQDFTIGNLTKAKDIIFKRVSELEANRETKGLILEGPLSEVSPGDK
jgi:hypothetical protein